MNSRPGNQHFTRERIRKVFIFSELLPHLLLGYFTNNRKCVITVAILIAIINLNLREILIKVMHKEFERLVTNNAVLSTMAMTMFTSEHHALQILTPPPPPQV